MSAFVNTCACNVQVSRIRINVLINRIILRYKQGLKITRRVIPTYESVVINCAYDLMRVCFTVQLCYRCKVFTCFCKVVVCAIIAKGVGGTIIAKGVVVTIIAKGVGGTIIAKGVGGTTIA